MSHLAPRVVAAVVLSGALSACPRSHDAEPDADAGPTGEVDCDSAAAAFREALDGCCGFSGPTLEAIFEDFCRPDGMRLGDPERLRECLQARMDGWAECLEAPVWSPDGPCQDLFEPDREAGEPCTDDECIDGLACVGALGHRRCQPPLAPGDPCVGDDCGRELVCVEGSCRGNLGLGETCYMPDLADVIPCVAGLYCSGGTCVELPGLGEPCLDLYHCAGDLGCTDGVCDEKRPDGEPCFWNHTCTTGFCDVTTGRCGMPATPRPAPDLCDVYGCIDCED